MNFPFSLSFLFCIFDGHEVVHPTFIFAFYGCFATASIIIIAEDCRVKRVLSRLQSVLCGSFAVPSVWFLCVYGLNYGGFDTMKTHHQEMLHHVLQLLVALELALLNPATQPATVPRSRNFSAKLSHLCVCM